MSPKLSLPQSLETVQLVLTGNTADLKDAKALLDQLNA
jgi:hypothetical protein